MVHHPILACKKIPNLAHIYLVGFYEEREFALYTSALSNELKIPVRYLREEKPHGSAGGLYHFQDKLLEEDPTDILVLNCDVCCSFPLFEMLAAHRHYKGMGTILVKKVSPEVASEFGELVADRETGELLHYAEKPETFVSDFINCGVYIFTPEIFLAIEDVASARKDKATLRRISSFEALQSATKMPIRCSSLYLAQYRSTLSELLAKGNGKRGPTIVGDVFVHPSAKTHPTAKIGPNVSISANAWIGPGVRLISCIILDDVEVKENAIIMNSIVGWKSSNRQMGSSAGGRRPQDETWDYNSW